MAANQDAIVTGVQYGFNKDNSIQVTSDPNYASQAFNACTASAIRSATTGECGFTPLERIASASDSDRNQNAKPLQRMNAVYQLAPVGH